MGENGWRNNVLCMKLVEFQVFLALVIRGTGIGLCLENECFSDVSAVLVVFHISFETHFGDN